ncbi:MAG: GGDEF domain-containing protein [Clostridiales bacterium]|nr:GGDEF domain-containing protein [Clostridiales bacterium]
MNKSCVGTELDTFIEKSMVETFFRIFRVNINTGEFEVYRDNGLLGDAVKDIPDIYAYMQRLIDDKIISPEYAAACKRFTNPEYIRKSIFSGEKRIVQSYKANSVGGIRWTTFAIIAMEDCSPENPIVIYTWRDSEAEAITLLDTLPTISSLYDKLIRINLSNNTFEPVLVDADEQERLAGGVINMYEWWAGYSKNGNIAPEDMGAFSMLTKAGSLQKHFAHDHTPISFRYRRKVNDEFRWVQLEIAPSVEYSENNQVMLLSLKDVHKEYTDQLRRHQELVDSMHHDALTNLYNRFKYNEDIEAYAKSSDPLFTCMYIDVNGLHELNNTLGHQKGDEMLCCIADTLRQYYPDKNVYRIGGDEFVVMSTELTKREVELAIVKVRRDLLKHNYEISVGIASGACGDKVEKIIAAAEHEMRNDKAAYYQRHGDRRKNRQMNEELERMLIEKHDTQRFLDLITSQFSGVYFVDLDNDTSRHIYDLKKFSQYLENANSSFSQAMRHYIQKHVKSEYRYLFDDVLDYDKLSETLRDKPMVELRFLNAEGYPIILRVLEIERRENSKPETIWLIWKKYDV